MRTDTATRRVHASPDAVYRAFVDPEALMAWLPPKGMSGRALVPDRRIVQSVEFESADPAFAGTMIMTWSFEPVPEGTRVTVIAEDIPSGIAADDHAAGLASSLENLAGFAASR